VREGLQLADEAMKSFGWLARRFTYLPGDSTDRGTYEELAARVEGHLRAPDLPGDPARAALLTTFVNTPEGPMHKTTAATDSQGSVNARTVTWRICCLTGTSAELVV